MEHRKCILKRKVNDLGGYFKQSRNCDGLWTWIKDKACSGGFVKNWGYHVREWGINVLEVSERILPDVCNEQEDLAVLSAVRRPLALL